MIKKNININFYLLLGLIILSFLLRFVTVYFVRDIAIDNEWNILIDNLVKFKSYSLYTFDNQLIPSVYMPPMYPFFIYLIKIITSFEGDNLIHLIIFIQIILSTYSVYVFYQLNQNFFSEKLSLINSFIFSFVPLNLYVCGQISSINLQIIFSLLFLKFFLLIIKEPITKNIIIFSMVSGLSILTRGEFILIFGGMIFFILLNKKIKFINFVKITLIVLLVISPYLVRNYIHFNQIFIVKSLGFNLWKGNNQLSTVDGFENIEKNEFTSLKYKLDNLEKNKYYEVSRDKIFLKEALYNINNNLLRYFKLFLKKYLSYYFIDINSKYPNYYNFFHIFPIILISLLSFPGLFVFYRKKKIENKCFGLYLFLNLMIFSIFFILPRYKLAILPVQIILASYFFIYIIKKLNKVT